MKVSRAIVDARRDKIAKILTKRRYLDISELCAQFAISEATARRDMNALEAAGRITRTRGGALGDYDSNFASFREREHRAYDAKIRIAAHAVTLLRPHTTIYLDAGSTLLAIARQLVAHPVSDITIVTNSLPVAEVLSGAEKLPLYLLGGQVLNRQAALLGSKAQAALGQWKFDVALLGAEGIDKNGIYNSQSDLVQFQRDIIAHSQKTFLCLDSTKLNHRTPHLLCSWQNAPAIITDAPPRQVAALAPKTAKFLFTK